MLVTDESCQTYEASPLFILNMLVGGPHWTTSVSTFLPIYSCPNRARTSGADAAQPPNAAQSATIPTTRICTAPHTYSSPFNRSSRVHAPLGLGEEAAPGYSAARGERPI